jgi:hypothetical protein
MEKEPADMRYHEGTSAHDDLMQRLGEYVRSI